MTADETRLVAHAFAVRDGEAGTDFWFAPALELRPEAHSLVLSGYLDYRTHGDGIVYRLTDQAVSAQGLASLTAGQCQN